VKIGNDAGMTQIKAVAQITAGYRLEAYATLHLGHNLAWQVFLLLHNFIYAFAFTVVEDSADPLEHKQAGIAWRRRILQEEQANSAVPRRKRAVSFPGLCICTKSVDAFTKSVRSSIERVGDHRSPPHKNKEQKKGKNR
jgi:hypothetical protein